MILRWLARDEKETQCTSRWLLTAFPARRCIIFLSPTSSSREIRSIICLQSCLAQLRQQVCHRKPLVYVADCWVMVLCSGQLRTGGGRGTVNLPRYQRGFTPQRLHFSCRHQCGKHLFHYGSCDNSAKQPLRGLVPAAKVWYMLPRARFWKNAIVTSIHGSFHIISSFTMSSSPLILITGANGFVGYAVLAGALKAKVTTKTHMIASSTVTPRMRNWWKTVCWYTTDVSTEFGQQSVVKRLSTWSQTVIRFRIPCPPELWRSQSSQITRYRVLITKPPKIAHTLFTWHLHCLHVLET